MYPGTPADVVMTGPPTNAPAAEPAQNTEGRSRWRRLLWLVGSGAVLLMALVAAAVVGPDGFRVEVRSFEASDDGNVSFEIYGCSNSLRPISAEERYGWWRVVDTATEEIVADTSHVVRPAIGITRSFGPRACAPAPTESWDGRYWNVAEPPPGFVYGNPVRGEPVPSGRYRLEATWGEFSAPAIEFDLSQP